MGAVTSKKKEYKVQDEDDENRIIEKVVGKVDFMNDGEMKKVELGQDMHVLLVKENGKFSALGTKCTHYGAPLVDGVLFDGKIRCPWHGACFNSSTGDIEEFPGLDSLPCYKVTVDLGEVKVQAPASLLKLSKRRKTLHRYSPTDSRTFVIVGGGGAAQTCIETLRQEGFTGKLVLITKEKHYPYDRPKMSKLMETKSEDLYLRNDDFFKSANITVMLETEVTSIDPDSKVISCGDKIMFKYDSAMIATGGQPQILDIPGNNLKNVVYLRTPEDANYIAENSVRKAVIIIGTSFIGMEVCSYLSTRARSINHIGRSDPPFRSLFGEEIGSKICEMLAERGVVFHLNSGVTRFIGSEKGILTGVELVSGNVLVADICIIGIGVRPATDFLKESGLNMNSKGHICVDEYLKTNKDGLFACGDIAEFPLAVLDHQKVNICHWQMAECHGYTAALNMLSENKQLITVPFFWSVICRKNIRYAGYGEGFDDIIIDGSVESFQFVAYYCVKERVVAVCTLNRDPVASHFASYMHSGNILTKEEIKADPSEWLLRAGYSESHDPM